MTVRTQSAEETLEIPLLSPAEEAILPLLLAGDTERDIASALDKSPATVSKQVGSIFRAFGVKSKPQLIARHFELLARQNLSQNGGAGVNTPLRAARPAPHNPPIGGKNGRNRKE